MHYLECIAMLNYVLQQLKQGQRVQVPASVINDVKTTAVSLDTKLSKENNDGIKMSLANLATGISMTSLEPGVENLPELVKEAYVDAFNKLRDAVGLVAFEYFKTNDFDDTNAIIPLMRDVVSIAALKGVL